MTVRASQAAVLVLSTPTNTRPRASQAAVLVLAKSETTPFIRVTQLPLLMVSLPVQNARVTQLPLLMVNLPVQNARVTQLPLNSVWLPTPIPLPVALVPDMPVIETWQWLTVVNVALNGKEQRTALRADPRVRLRLTIPLESNEERKLAYQMLSKFIKTAFDYPLYQYSTRVTAAATAGATKIFFNPLYANMRAGEILALYDITTDETTYVTTTTLDADGANLSSPLEEDVPAHILVCPALRFHTRPVVGLAMGGIDGVVDIELESMGVRSTVRPTSAPTVTTYDGFTVLNKRPLANQKVDENFDQSVEWLDNDIAPPEVKTYVPVPFVSGAREFLVHRPQDMDYWGTVLNTFNGRQKTFLLPTFRDDLPLLSQPALSATHIVTTNIQYFEFWRYKTWQYLQIETANGTIHRKVTEVTINYDSSGQPVSLNIKLNAALGGSAGDNVISSVSYMHLARLNSDEVVIEHGPVDSYLTLSVRAVNE